MKKEKNNKNLMQELKKCGVITCIHNTNNTCIQNDCEIYERTLKQEY